MTEFPRGWVLYSFANATGQAVITVPPIPGVTHVLDAVQANALAFAATSLFVVGITVNGVSLWNLLVQGIAGSVTTDAISYSGLDYAMPPGAALVAQFDTAAVTGIFLNLTIQGHDI